MSWATSQATPAAIEHCPTCHALLCKQSNRSLKETRPLSQKRSQIPSAVLASLTGRRYVPPSERSGQLRRGAFHVADHRLLTRLVVVVLAGHGELHDGDARADQRDPLGVGPHR